MLPTRFMVRNRQFTVIEQLNFLKSTYQGSEGNVSCNTLTWHCNIQPLSICDTYRLKITYKKGFYPKTYITSPKPLPLAKGAKSLPHTYDTKRQQLCLFYPGYYEWDSSMRIDETIVHWAAQWIVYYESWGMTGEWQGGGHGNWNAPKEAISKCE